MIQPHNLDSKSHLDLFRKPHQTICKRNCSPQPIDLLIYLNGTSSHTLLNFLNLSFFLLFWLLFVSGPAIFPYVLNISLFLTANGSHSKSGMTDIEVTFLQGNIYSNFPLICWVMYLVQRNIDLMIIAEMGSLTQGRRVWPIRSCTKSCVCVSPFSFSPSAEVFPECRRPWWIYE